MHTTSILHRRSMQGAAHRSHPPLPLHRTSILQKPTCVRALRACPIECSKHLLGVHLPPIIFHLGTPTECSFRLGSCRCQISQGTIGPGQSDSDVYFVE